MATRSIKSAAQQCVVTIDFNEYLLPLNKGLALVELMQHATKCDARYGGSGLNKKVFTEKTPPRVELEMVNKLDIQPKPDSDDGDDF